MTSRLRWQLADGDRRQGALFTEPVFEREPGRGEFRGLEFLHVRARRIINEIHEASFLPFHYSINVYRGCSHACSYCYARPSHAWLDLDTGDDFDRKIVVKVNAVSALRRELDPRRWTGHHIAMGTNTDPYQRCEGKYRLTRGVIEVLAEHANPFSILTKSTLVLRDLDLLAEAARRTDVGMNVSIGTLDEQVWRETEPGTPHPRRRLEAVRALNDAGVRCGVLMGPVIPGLSDRREQLEEVAAAAVAAGAVRVSAVSLHLRPGVREVFFDRLGVAKPEAAVALRRRYDRRIVLPAADQERVAGIVAAAVGRAGGIATPARRLLAGGPPRPARRASPPPDPNQLRLL